MLSKGRRGWIALTILAIASAGLSGCQKSGKEQKIFGLIPGVYYFESVVGANPEGMPFDSKSSCEFSESGKKVSDPTKLAMGTWDFQEYVKGADGAYIDKPGLIAWSNCFFATMDALADGGWGEDGVCHLFFVYPSQWVEKYSTYSVYASVSLGSQDDDDSRLLAVHVVSEDKKADFTVTFSRNV
jgi:hypothetical protein